MPPVPHVDHERRRFLGSSAMTIVAAHLGLLSGPGAATASASELTHASVCSGVGAEVQAWGKGTIAEQRLYQLIRQPGPISDKTFEIEFLDAGVEAFALPLASTSK